MLLNSLVTVKQKAFNISKYIGAEIMVFLSVIAFHLPVGLADTSNTNTDLAKAMSTQCVGALTLVFSRRVVLFIV